VEALEGEAAADGVDAAVEDGEEDGEVDARLAGADRVPAERGGSSGPPAGFGEPDEAPGAEERPEGLSSISSEDTCFLLMPRPGMRALGQTVADLRTIFTLHGATAVDGGSNR
jgi:hypothetical protein